MDAEDRRIERIGKRIVAGAIIAMMVGAIYIGLRASIAAEAGNIGTAALLCLASLAALIGSSSLYDEIFGRQSRINAALAEQESDEQ